MAWDFALPPQDPGARLGHPGRLGNPTRHTNRRPFDDVAVGPAEQRALHRSPSTNAPGYRWSRTRPAPDAAAAGRLGASRATRRPRTSSPRPLDQHQPW